MRLDIVVGGQVDHGKSSVLGRLLAETGAVPQTKIDEVRRYCAAHNRPFEYAFLTDVLVDEREQGITIDAARVFVTIGDRRYCFSDAPGHEEFLRNAVTGAARADAGLLVIDALDGLGPSTRLHARMLAFIGIPRVGVVVNKMDRVGYSQRAFDDAVGAARAFFEQCRLSTAWWIPASAASGENIATTSQAMPWFDGPTLVEAISRFSVPEASTQQFRMPVQDVYRREIDGVMRQVAVGTVATGFVNVGDEIVCCPRGGVDRVLSVEGMPEGGAKAGASIGLTFHGTTSVERGDLLSHRDHPPSIVSNEIDATVFWLSREPLTAGRRYSLRLGSANVEATVTAISAVSDLAATSMASGASDTIGHNQIGDCRLRLERAVACDRNSDIPETARFALIDRSRIAGGGIVLK